MMKLYLQSREFIKTFSIIAFVCIILSLIIILKTPPADGYEISIYDQLPLFFWMCLLFSYMLGISILFQQVLAQKKSGMWFLGFFIVIFVNIIVLSLPFFRDYAIYGRGDTLTHIGSVRDIINTGHIGNNNFYPISSIFIYIVDALPSSFEFEWGTVVVLVYIIFMVYYLLNMHLLAKSISKNKEQVLLITAFATPLIFSFFHVNIHPSMMSLFIIPLILYSYHKRNLSTKNKIQYTIILLIISFSGFPNNFDKL